MCGNGALVASSFLHLVLETLSSTFNFNKTGGFHYSVAACLDI